MKKITGIICDYVDRCTLYETDTCGICANNTGRRNYSVWVNSMIRPLDVEAWQIAEVTDAKP